MITSLCISLHCKIISHVVGLEYLTITCYKFRVYILLFCADTRTLVFFLARNIVLLPIVCEYLSKYKEKGEICFLLVAGLIMDRTLMFLVRRASTVRNPNPTFSLRCFCSPSMSCSSPSNSKLFVGSACCSLGFTQLALCKALGCLILWILVW